MIERRQYTKELKCEAVCLMDEGGVSLAQTSQQLGVNRSLLGKWKRQLQRETPVVSNGKGNETYTAFPGQGRPHDEELVRLHKENVALKMEHDVLDLLLLPQDLSILSSTGFLYGRRFQISAGDPPRSNGCVHLQSLLLEATGL